MSFRKPEKKTISCGTRSNILSNFFFYFTNISQWELQGKIISFLHLQVK